MRGGAEGLDSASPQPYKATTLNLNALSTLWPRIDVAFNAGTLARTQVSSGFRRADGMSMSGLGQ